jgi:hypothetical protein
MQNTKLPYYFNVKVYKQLNNDLQHLTDDEAIEHYKNHGAIEKRQYRIVKTAILFHVGNIDVFLKIYKNNTRFFKRNILIFVTLHNKDYIKTISQCIPNVFFTIIENKGADIGGFLHNIKKLINNPCYKDIENIYFIHTKTKDNWRRDLLSPLIKNYKKIESELENNKNTPIIIGSDKYCYRNKGTNRNYIEDIFHRNKDNFNILLKKDWHDYVDDYIFKNTNYGDSSNIYIGLNINPEFYKNYETDLQSLSNKEAIEQYNNHGINEYYRINNPCYVKKFGKESYFIAGTIFACNKEYFKIFEGINLDDEYCILETGYVLNTVPRKIHAWEYLFGLLAYSRNGHIISIDESGLMNVMKNKDNEFNIDIYRNCNVDLMYYNDIDLLLHYNSRGKYENRIFNRSQLYKIQSVINIDLLKATMAVGLTLPPDKYSHEYNKLLIKVNEISGSKPIDIYLGDNNKKCNTYHGLSTMNVYIYEVVKIIDSYNILDMSKCNFYLGFNLQRKYTNTIFL